MLRRVGDRLGARSEAEAAVAAFEATAAAPEVRNALAVLCRAYWYPLDA